MSSMAFFDNQGQITPRDWSDQARIRTRLRSYNLQSWITASLTKIRPIMNVLAWIHHFPIIVYEKCVQCSRQGRVTLNDPIRYLKVLRRSDTKGQRKGGYTIFPIISQRETLVAITTTVLIQSAANIMQSFPHHIDATHKI